MVFLYLENRSPPRRRRRLRDVGIASGIVVTSADGHFRLPISCHSHARTRLGERARDEELEKCAGNRARHRSRLPTSAASMEGRNSAGCFGKATVAERGLKISAAKGTLREEMEAFTFVRRERWWTKERRLVNSCVCSVRSSAARR